MEVFYLEIAAPSQGYHPRDVSHLEINNCPPLPLLMAFGVLFSQNNPVLIS